MAVDIGGSHVKFRLSNGGEERRDVSGPELTPGETVAKVQALARGLAFDTVSVGYPGPVAHGRIAADPPHLAMGWVGFDFAAAFGKPTKVVNDALMQAIGSYEGGRMLFLGLGTGLGSAMIVEHVAQPLELAHLPFKKGKTFEDYVSDAARKAKGKKKWRKHVTEAIERLSRALEPAYVVIGGGNATKLDVLPLNCRLGDNDKAFLGGFRLWTDERFKV